jgi:hypothetical protein
MGLLLWSDCVQQIITRNVAMRLQAAHVSARSPTMGSRDLFDVAFQENAPECYFFEFLGQKFSGEVCMARI